MLTKFSKDIVLGRWRAFTSVAVRTSLAPGQRWWHWGWACSARLGRRACGVRWLAASWRDWLSSQAPPLRPGLGAVCLVLLITSGAEIRSGSSLGRPPLHPWLWLCCGWWLIGYLAASQRVVRWDFSLADAWNFGTPGGALAVAALGRWGALGGPLRAAPVAAPRRGGRPPLWASPCAGRSYWALLRPDRWLQAATLAAALAIRRDGRPSQALPSEPGFAAATRLRTCSPRLCLDSRIRSVTLRFELLFLVGWLLWWPRRVWAAAGALAWVGLVLVGAEWGHS